MIAPASGGLLSSAKAAVISSASGATCTWPITAPSWLAKAATTCTPSLPPGRGTPAQALAVDRHGSERSGPLRPGAQHLFGRGHVEGLVEVVVHGVAGRPLEAEQVKRLGREPAAPAEARATVLAAGQHSGQRQRQDRAQGIAASFGSAPVRDVAQCFPHGPARTELSCIAHNHPPDQLRSGGAESTPQPCHPRIPLL